LTMPSLPSTPTERSRVRRSSVFVIRTRRRQRRPTIPRRLTSASELSGPKWSSDGGSIRPEALHESAACTNHRPPRRHRWGSCRRLLEVHRAPNQQQVAESSVGDEAEADATEHSKRSVLGSTGSTTRLGKLARALRRHPRAEARIRGVRIPLTQLGLAPWSGIGKSALLAENT
jgi:hypothetical protein